MFVIVFLLLLYSSWEKAIRSTSFKENCKHLICAIVVSCPLNVRVIYFLITYAFNPPPTPHCFTVSCVRCIFRTLCLRVCSEKQEEISGADTRQQGTAQVKIKRKSAWWIPRQYIYWLKTVQHLKDFLFDFFFLLTDDLTQWNNSGQGNKFNAKFNGTVFCQYTILRKC